MKDKRAVEHYKGHELVVEVVQTGSEWRYVVSVVSHQGDSSEAVTEESVDTFRSDLEALHAGTRRGRPARPRGAAAAGRRRGATETDAARAALEAFVASAGREARVKQYASKELERSFGG